MDRRETIIALVALGAVPLAAAAQQATKIARMGYMAGNLTATPYLPEALRQGLRDLGYVEGRNLVIEYRDAQGKLERLPALAAELVALKVDVIFAPGALHVQAVKQATATIPVVFADVDDPVARGFVADLTRPRGNITGLANLNTDLIGKWLELLKQAVPRVNHVAFLWQPSAIPGRARGDIVKRAENAGRTMEVRLQFVEVRGPEDFDRAFSDMTRARVDALIVWRGSMMIIERRRVVELVGKYRLPATYPMAEFVDAGGLMSYGPNVSDSYRHAATYVDKILKGTKPGDLPVEQAGKFELIINLNTAKSLGLTIPQSLLLRAERVIQ